MHCDLGPHPGRFTKLQNFKARPSSGHNDHIPSTLALPASSFSLCLPLPRDFDPKSMLLSSGTVCLAFKVVEKREVSRQRKFSSIPPDDMKDHSSPESSKSSTSKALEQGHEVEAAQTAASPLAVCPSQPSTSSPSSRQRRTRQPVIRPRRPALRAAERNDADALLEILSFAPQLLYSVNKRGETAAHVAARVGSIAAIEVLLEIAPSLFHRHDRRGRLPAHVSTIKRNSLVRINFEPEDFVNFEPEGFGLL